MMELFSELYGCYYAVVAEILRCAPLSRGQIEALVAQQGYGESTLHLIPRLLDQGNWSLLEEREGRYHSRLRQPPQVPVTALERAWLRALLDDPRVRLFLSDAQLSRLSQDLAGVAPLYRQEDMCYFDRYLDGDPFDDPEYRARFHGLLAALRRGVFLRVEYDRAKGRPLVGHHLPLRLEYSAKDDKFRVYTAKAWHGAFQGYHILNLSRILALSPSLERCDAPLDLEAWRRSRRCSQPLLIRVTGERNGIERFMVEFSSYEKYSEYDEQSKTCTVRLWYQQEEETELLIRLLGFGPVLQVLEPAPFVAQIRGRVRRQAVLLGLLPPTQEVLEEKQGVPPC